ncbi:MAG: transcriptional regulator [Rhodospirillaceae bacterium]|nr:MAG: transcriptional regulator [Rhodospirillaceae bacterium]
MISTAPEPGSETIARRPGRPRSTAVQQAILQGTYRLMATQGLSATTYERVAAATGVSKVTIYKWWPTREALLVDAFLEQARTFLPLPENGHPVAIVRAHAASYVAALNGTFGRVQLAVIAECIGSSGTAATFGERYLGKRRAAGVALLMRAQKEGLIGATDPPADLYDMIYGTLFYQSTFGLRKLTAGAARRLVDRVLRPAG